MHGRQLRTAPFSRSLNLGLQNGFSLLALAFGWIDSNQKNDKKRKNLRPMRRYGFRSGRPITESQVES